MKEDNVRKIYFQRFLSWSGIVLMLAMLSQPAAGQELPKAFIDGTGPGWKTLGEGDFVNVNGEPDT